MNHNLKVFIQEIIYLFYQSTATINDEAYVRNLNEYKDIATYWVSIFLKAATYLDSF